LEQVGQGQVRSAWLLRFGAALRPPVCGQWRLISLDHSVARLPAMVGLALLCVGSTGVTLSLSCFLTTGQRGLGGVMNISFTRFIRSRCAWLWFAGWRRVMLASAVVLAAGISPYTWSITSGSLPAGLSLDPATGAISGTPTGAETGTFTVTVTDSDSPAATASASLSIGVNPGY